MYGCHLWFAEKPEIIYREYTKWVGGKYKPYGTPELKNRSLRVKTGEVATLARWFVASCKQHS
jgi:hypothetical protein